MKATIFVTLGALAACGKGGLGGKHVGTDHFHEGRTIGDVQVTVDASSPAITVAFAPPAADWKDTRPAHLAASAPQALLALAACTLTAKQGDSDFAKVDPGQTCTANGKTLKVTSGKVWMFDKGINVDLTGDVDGREYSFLFPLLLGSDPALPAN